MNINDFLISLNENDLKVTLNSKEGFGGILQDIPKEIADGSSILDVAAFSDVLNEILNQFPLKKNRAWYTLNFLIEPADVYLRFVTVSKSDVSVDEYIIERVKADLASVSLDELYFSYQKIAPFVYQFIALPKEKINQLLEVSNILGISLKSVVPWVLLLPRFLSSSEPSIFVTKANGTQVIVLSELKGVYFSQNYKKEKSLKEIQALIQDLSVFNRTSPITQVFTIDYDKFKLDEKYVVSELFIPDCENEENVQFKLHLMCKTVLQAQPNIYETQLNLLNLLPLPAVAKKSSLVYVGGVVAALVIGSAIFGYALYLGRVSLDTDSGKTVAQDVSKIPAVLSETNVDEGTASTTATETLARVDLKIRVENGAGVAGIAAEAQTFLEDLGYTVTDIGNADEAGRKKTLLKFKESALGYKDLLTEDLKDEFDFEIEEDLDATLEHDVLIIVGLN